jgi:hypothetical protein
MTQNKTLINARRKLIEVANNRYLRGFSRLASKLLETGSLIKAESKLSYLTAGISLLDSAGEAFELPMHDKVKGYAEAEGLIEHQSNLASIVINSGLADNLTHDIVLYDKEQERCLKKLNFGFGELYYVLWEDDFSFRRGNNIAPVFYTSPSLDMENLFDFLWQEFGQGVFLTIENGTDENNVISVLSNLRFHKFQTSEMLYIGNSPNLENFQLEVKRYRDKKISRSYMLIGEPGTGKSSFAVATSKPFTNRILKIDPNVTGNLGTEEIVSVLKNLRPEVVILDDFDTDNSPKQMLFALEMIKQCFPNVIIFATVNDFNSLTPAIVRPGRIDKRIWFDLPDEDSRRSLAKYYLDLNKVAYEEYDLERVVAETEGMSPVYIKDLCIRIGAEESWNCFDDIISEYRRTLESLQEEDEEIED